MKRGTLVALVIVATAWAAMLGTAVRAQQAASDEETKIWTGVYTEAQAARGKNIYEAYCTRCHGLNLLGGRQGGVGGPALKDNNFWVSWERAPLAALYGKTSRTMPADSPASLREDDYTDVVAFLLSENKFPAGKVDLPPTGLDAIRIVRKAGETSEIPDFALVQVVGCLTPGSNQTWTLTQATDPLLTRDDMSTPQSLAAAARQPAGKNEVRLISAGQHKPQALAGQRVEARGLLNKDPRQGRLDVLSLKSIGASCAN